MRVVSIVAYFTDNTISHANVNFCLDCGGIRCWMGNCFKLQTLLVDSSNNIQPLGNIKKRNISRKQKLATGTSISSPSIISRRAHARPDNWVGDIVKADLPIFFGIQETKLEHIDSCLIRSIWSNLNVDFAFCDSTRALGGILTMWDSCYFVKEQQVMESNFLVSYKEALWLPIELLINSINVIWIIFGDFNVVRSRDERAGSNFDQREASAFNDFIARAGLFNFPLGGRKFTRFDKGSSKLSKLDRFLVSHNFFGTWNNASVIVLCRTFLDHCPILISCGLPDFGPKPLNFFNKWIGNMEMLDVISNSCSKSLKNELFRSLVDWDNKAECGLFTTSDIDKGEEWLMDLQALEKLSVEDALFLESSISMEEVKAAVWNCASSKSSRPDGLNFKFVKTYWNIIKDEFFEGIKYFEASATRLAKVIPSIVGLNQTAFLVGRQILDGCLIANEIIHMANLEDLKLLLFKVDFEKAFDSVCWGFLSDIMSQMVVEALQVAILEACNKGIFKGVSLSDSGNNLSLLQYADDALFFGKWSRSNAVNLVLILKCFEEAFGLKVSLSKSRFYRVGVDRVKVERWTYLLVARGRLTLIKSILGSIPIYYLSLFKAPLKIINLLKSIRARFFWGFKEGGRGISWVKWNSILLNNMMGGLDVGSLLAKNLRLLGKWKWRFLTEKDALWRKVIKEFYGENGGFGSLRQTRG
ncbi:RNA-directed DNA polymerase, eukaryota [Tanacetum coccineum]